MKKWAIQMRNMTGYFKYAAKIDGQDHRILARVTYVLLSLLFFGAFFVWFNDRAALIDLTSSSAFSDPMSQLAGSVSGGTVDVELINKLSGMLVSVLPQILRLVILPPLTFYIIFIFTVPYIYSTVYSDAGLGEIFAGRKLFSVIRKGFLRQMLVLLVIAVPVFVFSIFFGGKYFLNTSMLSAIVYALTSIFAYFTVFFQIDPRDTDSGSNYPYKFISDSVKDEVRKRAESSGYGSMRESVGDINEIRKTVEESFEAGGIYNGNKTRKPHSKAWMLFKITWGRTLILVLILQLLIPVVQMLLQYIMSFTRRGFVVYAALAFATAFFVMFELRYMARIYFDLVHGVNSDKLRLRIITKDDIAQGLAPDMSDDARDDKDSDNDNDNETEN